MFDRVFTSCYTWMEEKLREGGGGMAQVDPADLPEEIRRNQEQIAMWVEELGGKYGYPKLRDYLLAFSEKMTLVSQLNQLLAELQTEDEPSFGDTVQQILDATQDYYGFIGGLPDDMRRFLLQVADASGAGDGAIEGLNDLLDTSLPGSGAPLLSLQSIRPRNYVMQVDAISNQLAELGEPKQLRVGQKGSQPVNVTVSLDMPDHMKIEGGGALSTYDKSIINGITSLMESGNSFFSIPMLYHAMTGKQNPTVDDALSEELAGKLEKMRRMLLTVDLSEDGTAPAITDENGDRQLVENLTLEGYLLPLNKVSGRVNGRRAELYQILQYPPLYTYSKMKRQLASVPISMLDAPVNNNATTIPLKTYLLQRIELMKNKKNSIVSSHILYDSIYEELGALEAGKTRKMRIRNYTTTVLSYFVEQGYIQSYVEFKKGRAIAGVNIFL